MSAKTKIAKKSILFLAFFLTWIGFYAIINSWSLVFTDLSSKDLIANFSQVFFNSEWNNFGGGIFWLDSKTYSKTISIDFAGGWNPKKCVTKMSGIYYNNARWARLWPLDQSALDTLKVTSNSYNNLTLTGWFYTSCQWNDNARSIFGYIKYTLSGDISYLIAWASLDYTSNDYSWVFKNNFQYFNGKTPLWYIWDSIGGIWFVGWEMSGTQNLLTYLDGTGKINNAFTLQTGMIVSANPLWTLLDDTTGNAKDTMWNLLVQGNTILSKTMNVWQKISMVENLDKRSVLLSSSDINSSTIINTAKKNAEALCRGNSYTYVWTAPTEIKNIAYPNKVLCFTWSSDLWINLGNTQDYKDKTIIIKNGNITLSGNMNKNNSPLDIFIDWWSLFIDSNTGTNFNIQWFPDSTGINQGIFLKGNFVVNGLLLGWTPSAVTTVKHKLHIQGKIVSLNTPSEPSQWRIDQVTDILWSTTYSSRIGLEDLLSWKCLLEGTANDWTTCGDTEAITSTPFVVLDGSFPSQIIK